MQKCKNAISKVLKKLQVFHFRCTVHTNTTPTVITHSCVLQKPPSCNDNGYKFEFKICRPNRHVSKILAKKWNAETLKAIVSKTAQLAKLPPGGFLFIHEIWRFHTKCRIF